MHTKKFNHKYLIDEEVFYLSDNKIYSDKIYSIQFAFMKGKKEPQIRVSYWMSGKYFFEEALYSTLEDATEVLTQQAVELYKANNNK